MCLSINPKIFYLVPQKCLWLMVLHCQFPKRYQHHTESRVTWDSHGKWSLTTGWAALCGCVSLFMATGRARSCVQTGHLTFHRTDKSHLSPNWLLSQLYCSGATQEKIAPNEPTCHYSRCSSKSCLFSAAWVGLSVPLDSRCPPFPLRDTQLGILHCPWWFLLGQDWSHGGQIQSFALQNSPAAPLSWGFPPLHALTHVNTQVYQF